MEARLYNQSFSFVAPIDSYKSFIWTERYLGYGDFELVISALDDVASLIVPDTYLKLENENSWMIAERTEISKSEEGEFLKTIVGRSLESILTRRVVWIPRTLKGSLQTGIKTLIDDNLISSSSSFRNIPNFAFAVSADTAITSLTLDEQLFGDNLYDVLLDVCESYEISYRIKMPTLGNFVFELFVGKDRSYSQSANPHVIFSPRFDNLVNSKSVYDLTNYKTSAIVKGADNLIGVKDSPAYPSGILRREIYVDATNTYQKVDGVTMPIADYNKILTQKGLGRLAENPALLFFDGEAADTEVYRYGVHFFLGDIVQLEDEAGNQGRSRVIEYIRSQDESESRAYPTFAAI